MLRWERLPVFTLCRIGLTPARKPYWIWFLLTHRTVIAVRKRHCASLIVKVDRHIISATLRRSVNRCSDRSGNNWVAARIGTPEQKDIFRIEEWDLVLQTLWGNCSGTMCEVWYVKCVNGLFQFCSVNVYAEQQSLQSRHENISGVVWTLPVKLRGLSLRAFC